MHIIHKLNHQVDKLSDRILDLENENRSLKSQIAYLNDQNDRLKYNNENMLLNIDKALSMTKVEKEDNNDISYQP